MPPKFKLCSFRTCPWVHRAAIVLQEKGVDYENLLSERISTWFARHFGTLDREFHTLVN